MLLVTTNGWPFPILLQSGIVPRGTRAFVFERIFEVFLLLGLLVGVVVIGYMTYVAYRYRDGDGDDAAVADADRPALGELPTGSGGGKKLFTSFALSTVVVVSLIAWTYGTLLFIEEGPSDDAMEVDVDGYQFGWEFTYPNGHSEDGVLRIPQNESVRLVVGSDDVFHTFGVPDLRVKSDAIPGQDTETWVRAEETGNYTVVCYELCGSGHSYMRGTVVVMEPDEYEEWYESTGNETEAGAANGTQEGSA